jgi:hypothetical protein
MSAIECSVLTGNGAVERGTGDVHTSLGIYDHPVHIAELQAARRDKTPIRSLLIHSCTKLMTDCQCFGHCHMGSHVGKTLIRTDLTSDHA